MWKNGLWNTDRGNSQIWRGGLWKSEKTDPPVSAEIIGVVLVDANTKGGNLVHIDADGNTITSPSSAAFDSIFPWSAMTEQVIDGQTMVKLPKCYYKRGPVVGGTHDGKDAWWISSALVSGFTLFPAFDVQGVEADQVWYGKYEASLAGDKLASVAAVAPIGNRAWDTYQVDADKRNVGSQTGWCMAHADMHALLQWLFLVEYATFDSQAAIAAGNVSTGSMQLTGSADNEAASYRGVYALWGNTTEYHDGLRTDGTTLFRRGYQDELWVNTAVSANATPDTIYPMSVKADAAIEDMFIPATQAIAESNALVPDGYRAEQAPSQGFTALRYSGHNGNGAVCGLFYQRLDFRITGSTSQHALIGTRLGKVDFPFAGLTVRDSFAQTEESGDVKAHQGVAFDGMHYYTTGGDGGVGNTRTETQLTLYKWDAAWNLVDSRDCANDGSQQQWQINGIYYDAASNRLYVGANNFQGGSESPLGWVHVYNASDLSFVEHHSNGAFLTEAVWWHDGSWWLVHASGHRVEQYDNSWTLVKSHQLPDETFTSTLDDLYWSAIFVIDGVFYLNHHAQGTLRRALRAYVYDADADTFVRVRAHIERPNGQCSQGAYVHGSNVYWAARYSGTDNRVVRSAL